MPPYTFTLLDDAGGRFATDGDTITVAGVIEGETAYPVTIQAVDQSAPERVVTQAVSITVPLTVVDYAILDDFKRPEYKRAGTDYSLLSGLPGYAYVRSGAKSELSSTGTPIAFAANVPGVVPGVGYWSRAALTNLVLQSQAFDNASWTKAGLSVTPNSAVAPDGTTTMDALVESAVSTSHNINQAVTDSAGFNTASAFLKANGRRYVYLRLYVSNGDNAMVLFDLQTGTLVSVTDNSATLSNVAGYVVNCGNGVYRCVAVYERAAGGTMSPVLDLSDTATPAYSTQGAYTYLGDGTSGVLAWQAQVIAGKHLDGGPIIPTTTAAATVGADALEVAASLPNGDFIIWIVFDAPTHTFNRGLFALSTPGAGSSTEYILLRLTAAGVVDFSLYIAAGVAQPVPAGVTGVTAGRSVAMFRRRNGIVSIGVKKPDGAIVISADAAGVAAVPSITALDLGSTRDGLAQINGRIEGVYQRNGTFTDAQITAILERALGSTSLDFKQGAYLTNRTDLVALNSLAGYTFARSGEQGAVDSDGTVDFFAAAVPAINGKGYHVYAALTNALLHSQNVTQTAWVKNAVIITADAAVAPDGTTTADKITVSSVFGAKYIYQNSALTVGLTYSDSYFVKAAGYTWAQIGLSTNFTGSGNSYVNVDLSTGAIGLSGGTGLTVTVTALADGWYRITGVGVASGTGSGRMTLTPLDSNRAGHLSSFAGNDVDGIFVWQGQRFQSNLPDGGPIILTTTATAAIGASDLEVAASLPAGDFLIWIAFTLPVVGGQAFLFEYSTPGLGTVNERLALEYTGLGFLRNFTTVAGGVVQPLAPNIASAIVAGRNVAAIRRLNGILSLAHKSPTGVITIGANASGVAATPAVTAVDIGCLRTGTFQINGQVEGFYQRNGTFSDAELTTILGEA